MKVCILHQIQEGRHEVLVVCPEECERWARREAEIIMGIAIFRDGKDIGTNKEVHGVSCWVTVHEVSEPLNPMA